MAEIVVPELSWDDIGGKRNIKQLKVPGLPRPIRYFDSLPLDVELELSAKHAEAKKAGNMTGYIIDILKEIMIEPECRTEEAARAALKASSKIIGYIIDDVATYKDAAASETPKR